MTRPALLEMRPSWGTVLLPSFASFIATCSWRLVCTLSTSPTDTFLLGDFFLFIWAKVAELKKDLFLAVFAGLSFGRGMVFVEAKELSRRLLLIGLVDLDDLGDWLPGTLTCDLRRIGCC